MNINLHYTEHTPSRFDSIIAYPAEEMSGPAIVEVGPGRGDFLFHLAETNPEKVIYGIDIKGKRFDKLIIRRARRKLFNIKLILADAARALPEIFEKESVEAIYINFPDPWPKKRHSKNRLLKQDFLETCAKALKTGGALFITTDVESYARETFEYCSRISQLKSAHEGIVTESADAYPTLFAQKWKTEGRTIYYQKHVKTRCHREPC